MSLAEELRRRWAAEAARWPEPPAEADARLERLAEISPVYRDLVSKHPDYWAWVERPQNLREAFRYGAFAGIWREDFQDGERAAALRRFRRKMSFRAAYREVNELCGVGETLRELSLLAEFVLREALGLARAAWEARLGRPHDAAGAEARFCVLALGKLGGEEINFCSDVDLILFYQGEGVCRKDGHATAIDNGEFFTRMARDYCALLQEQTGDGFLYNVDLRLRPEGESGRLVPSWAAMTNYYWATGQTWERLALIRARPVAGDLKLGQELLEELNPFRYPRAVSPGLLQEVAGVKIRLEREVVGRDRLERDIKSGYGGIREVEFSVQARQLLEGGRNPFLQTAFLPEAIDRLARYHLMTEAEAAFLKEAYGFLRLVENRLQLREEQAVHRLPAAGRPERELLAKSLGFADTEGFDDRLAKLREGVRRHYAGLFADSTREAEMQEWTLVLGGREPTEELAARVARWFPRSQDATERLRKFVLGPGGPLMREQVGLFLDVSGQFDAVLPQLARPLGTLERVAKFGEKYGARRMFFKALVENPGLFRALALLFDRSTAIHEWLCAHPDIMEELLYVAAERRKSPAELDGEIAALAKETGDFPRLLRLYVKAEQVRAAMAELLFHLGREEMERWLTELADAALAATLREADPEGRLTVIALGKYGGGELAIGSDLDILLVAPEDDPVGDTRRATAWRHLLGQQHPMGRAFELDLRLRPHGRDGPLVTTPAALRAYHAAGGGAQTWERQLLTRARVAAGGQAGGRELLAWRDVLIYSGPAPAGSREDLRLMRQRIEAEKTRRTGSERAFKAGPGGLLDVEFAAQWLQLAHGWEAPAMRSPNTRAVVRAARDSGYVKKAVAETLLEHYEVLRHVEWALRRETGTGVSVLPEAPKEMDALALWLGRADGAALGEELKRRRAEVRWIYEEITGPPGERKPG